MNWKHKVLLRKTTSWTQNKASQKQDFTLLRSDRLQRVLNCLCPTVDEAVGQFYILQLGLHFAIIRVRIWQKNLNWEIW
jgi:hypothetical protein